MIGHSESLSQFKQAVKYVQWLNPRHASLAIVVVALGFGCAGADEERQVGAAASSDVAVQSDIAVRHVTEPTEVRTGPGVLPGTELLEPLPPTMSVNITDEDARSLLGRADIEAIAGDNKATSIVLGLYSDNLLTVKETGELVYDRRPVYVYHFDGVECPLIGRTPFDTTPVGQDPTYSCYSEAFVDANTGELLFESGSF
jgi:hypothetical protein